MFQDKAKNISLEELSRDELVTVVAQIIPEVQQQQGRVVQELEIARSVVTLLKSQAGVNI